MALRELNFDPFAEAGTSKLRELDFDPFADDTSAPEAVDDGPGAISRGFVSGMLEQNPQMMAEALEGMSHLAPEQFRETLQIASQDMHSLSKLSPEEYKPRAKSIWETRGIGDALTWAGETLGQGLASTVPSVITGTAGAVVGGRVGRRPGAMIGGAAGAAVPSAALNYGELYKALKDEGVAPEDAADWAVYGAAPMVALDTVSIGPIVARFGGISEARRQLARSLARRIAAEGAKGAGREGFTEAAQEAVKEATVSLAADKPFWTVENLAQIAESGVAGALTGGAIGGASGVVPDRPKGEREKAAEQPPELTPEDVASPIPNDLIAEGKKVLQEVDATKRAEDILSAAGLPGVGSRVTIDYGDGRTASGVIDDAFTGESAEIGLTGEGVKIRLDDGTTFEEFFDTLAQAGVRIAPELQAELEERRQDADPDADEPETEPEPVAEPAPLDTTDLLPLDQREQPDLLGGPTVREADADEQAAGLVEEARAEMSDAEIRAALAEMEGRGASDQEVKIGDVNVHDSRGGEMFGTKSLTVGGVTKAVADISIYGDEVAIMNITVAPDARRGGLASRLVDDLFREFPDKTIMVFGGLTDDGAEFFRSRYDVADDGTITPKADAKPALNDNNAELPIFTGKTAFSDDKYGASIGSVSEGNHRQLMVDPDGGFYWGDWRQESQRDIGAVPGGKDKDGEVAYFASSKEAREAAKNTPQSKTSPSGSKEAPAGINETQQEEPQQKKPKAKAEPEPQRKLKEKIAAKRAENAPRKVIGKNRDGQTLEEDERGVRSFVRDGIRITEPVVMRPDGGMSVDRTNRPEFQTTDERSADSPTWAEVMSALPKDTQGRPDLTVAARLMHEITGKKQPGFEDLDTEQRFRLLEEARAAKSTPQTQATETPISATVEQEATRGEEAADTQDRGVEDRGAVPAARQVYETVEEIKQAVREGTLKTKPDRAGFCYRFASEAAIRGDGDYVIATVGHRTKGRIFHAVVEAPDGSIYDPQFDAWFSRRAYDDAIGGMVAVRRMTGPEVEAFGERTGKYPDPVTLGFDRPATDYRPGMTEPGARDTVKPEEDTDGVQDRVSRSDAPAGAEDVQPAPAERATGRARSGQERGGAPDAERDAQQRAETAERSPEEPRSPAPGRGDRDGDADRVPERRDAGRASGPAESVKGENFRIEPGALAEGRGWVQKARDNIRAIELMRQIEAEGRPATAEEQAQLALYVGWGGIRGAFPDTDGKFGKGFEEIGKKLKELLTETEYATARRSIQYAHYTSETVVRAMWDAARRLGFRGGKVFEPGMGVGNFAGMMPADLAEATMYNGLELDHTTARIARLLYPKWGVRQDDFTKAPLPKDTYDLVIGNPPFADIPIKSDPEYAKHSFLLHDYFFAKSLDAVRPGGLLMFVTSAGTMNKIDQSAREYMADRADLVGAVRLPGDAFEKNAGTSVTTDIIILRKRLPGEKAGDRSWVETAEVTLPNKEGKPTKGRVNSYFVEHPEMVLGEEGFFDKLYAGRYGVRSDGRDLGDALAKAMASLPENVMAERQTPEERAEVDFGTAERKEGSFYIGQDGKLYQMRDGVGRRVELRGKGVDGGVTLAAMERIKGLIPIRDALRAVYDADLKGDVENAAKARERLNRAYDRFVQRFGPINKAEISYRRPNVIQQEAARSEAREEARFAGLPFDEGSFDPTDLIERGASLAEIARQRKAAKEEAEKAGREWREGTFDPDEMPDIVIDKRPNVDPFMDDPESYRLRAIERYNDETGEAEKTDVFYKNVITREKAPEIKSVGDALLYVLNKRGRVDLAEIAAAAGVSESEAVEQLGNAIFKVPGTETWQTREQYLSGNVRQKLRQAKAAAERNPEFQRNVEALEAAQPAPLPPSEINANLGMPWLPPNVIEDFGKSLGLERIRVRYVPALAQWFVEGDTQSAAATSTWGTSDRPAPYLISDALNRTDPKVYDTIYEDGKKKQVLNAEATQAAQDKVREIKERFAEWVWSDPARADELAALYNEQYNNLVVPEYDGSYLTTPGISAHWQWRPHQKRAIARIIQSGNTYLAHAVGAGKTSEMIGAAMEMRRLGLVKKPMFVVPNHMLGQFTKEFYEQYPTARIAVADERRFHTDRRKQFIADVANDDLDAIIITHSAFGLIPVSDAFQDSLIQEQIDQYRDILEDTDKNDPEQRITRRRLENAIEKLEQRLTGKKGRKDQVYTFEEMGVDFLFVDEAHLFRKLDFATKMSNVKGISPEGSKASFDLYTKTRYLETINPGRNLVLASGTPVTNTMAELYTVSRYLQPQELASRGLSHFDAWAGAFGDTVTQLEQDPAGGYKPVTRFAKFVNVPELSAMVRQVMDVVTSRQLEQYVTRPKLKGGKRQMNLAEKTEELDAYQQQLARRMQAIAQRKGPPKPGDDIILNVINDGRHAAIDMRLVDPTLPNDPGSKLNLLVDNVFRIWQETKRQPFHAPGPDGYSKKPVDYGPATQMIFANLGVGDSRPFSVHRYIVSELVRRGVPKDEIALIADYKTHVAKQRLFNDMNEGKKRVLIGSTAKMATGVNAQRRLYALHNLDPLWYPADDEQRNGRIIRQGNMNPEVEIHDYSTKGTYDSTMWGLMETKARFIQGFFEGDTSIRDMEDLGEASQYEQAKAITTADPRLIELTDLKQQLEKARRRKAAFEREQYAVRERIGNAKTAIARADERIPQIEADIARRQDTSGENFNATAGRKTYTDRAEFGEALLGQIEVLQNEEKERKGIKLGEIGGFEIKADVRQMAWIDGKPWRAEVYIAREGGFDTEIRISGSARGLVQSLENALRGFEGDLEFQRRRKAEAEKTIADYTPQLDKQFTGQPEIDNLAKRVRELEGQLAAEAQALQQAQQPTEEGEKFSIRREFRGDLEKIAEQLQGRLRQLRIDDKIVLRLTEKIRSLSTGEAIPGVEGRYYRGLLQVALGARDRQWTLNHEAIHAMREIGLFRAAEWRTLEKAAKADTARMDEIRRRYGRVRTLTEEALVEEAIADMFADWAAGRMQVRGFIRDAFERIRAFLLAVYDALTGNGYRTLDDIFMAVETGRVGRRRDLRGRFAQEMLTGIDETGPMGLSERFMVAWHGSPYDFDEFMLDRIGTGEGAQAFGWGLYFAGNKEVADFYRRKLSSRDGSVEYKGKTVLGRNGKPFLINHDWQGDLLNFLEYAVDNNMTAAEAIAAIRKRKREGGFFKNFLGVPFDNRLLDLLENKGVTIGRAGRLYKVDLAPQEDEYLLWDKSLSEQSPKVQEAIRRLPVPPYAGEFLKSRIAAGTGSMSGKDFYNSLSVALARRSPEDQGPGLGDYRAASMALRGAGIPGIKYLDGSSRRKGEGNYNYVIFDDSLVSIEEKFSISRSRTGDLIYSNEYRKRSADEMRMFERPARVVHAPVSGTRPSGMPRPVWNDMVEKPWVIELPTAGNAYKQYPIRYRTEEEARSAVERMMPDEIERAAYRIASSPSLVDSLQKELEARGFSVSRDDAKTTESKYLYVDVGGTTVKMRFSGHSKTVFLGGASRSHAAGYWDFSLGYSKPEGTQKIASIISLLEQARGGEEKFSIERPARPAGANDTVRFDDAKTEKRWQEARKGIAGQETLVAKTRDWLDYLVRGFQRHYINLPDTAEFADVTQQLRKLEAAPQASKERVVRILRQITDGFTPADLDLFTRKVVLDDLAWEASLDHALPFGFTPETLTREKAKIDAIIERRPDLAAAVRKRKLIIRKVANDLVAAGVLHKDQVKNPAYYRHQVLDYAKAVTQYAKGTGKKLRTPYWAKRQGSTLDINANLLEAEFDWLHKAFVGIETVKTINWIKNSKHNIRSRVIAAAREHNNVLVKKALERDLEENGFIDNHGRQTSPLIEEWKSFKQRIAMGLSRVRKAIENGELFVPDEFEDAARNLTGEASNDASIFPFLSWILDNGEAGADGAGQAFLAMSERREWTKDLLGDRYADPMNVGELVKRFAPEGYVAWQPDAPDAKGKALRLYISKTVPEHVVERVIQNVIAEMPGLPQEFAPLIREGMKAQARNALAVGSAKYEMVIPEELADTLNNLRDDFEEHIIAFLAERPTRLWKVWTLFNPRRVIKYNLNNLSGDLDAVIAGNPRIMRQTKRAAKELWSVMIRREKPSARYEEAVERGVFDSGFTIQEIPDINTLSDFENLTKPVNWKNPAAVTAFALRKGWVYTRTLTTLRENIFRYAAYLDFVERLEAGESVEKIGYGASRPVILDAIKDNKDKAALMARDLIGDYGAISAHGQQLRRYILPFWSFQEINIRRYWRLNANAWREGFGKGLRTSGYLMATVGLRRTAWLYLRMAALYAIIQVWNNLVFGDDEEEMTPEERARLHLHLWKTDDGELVTLRLQGALSDIFSWFGLEDAVQAAVEVERGRASLGDILLAIAKAPVNKVVNAVTPSIKAPLESAAGVTLFPDAFEPRPVRDGWRQLFRTFALEHEYDLVMDKPSRGYGRSWQETVVNRSDPGEMAYHRIRSKVYAWKEKVKGEEGYTAMSTPRSEALYEWRLAKRYGDEEAERTARQKLRDLGVTPSDLEASIKRAHPLGALTIKDRAAFLRTLSDKERDLLDQANLWYRQTFN